MSRFLRFLGVFVVAIACVFGGDTTHATGNSPSHTFEVTTTNLDANTTFRFAISAAGNFTVDWGDGSAVETITKSNTNNQEIYHTYTNGGVYTIGLDGLATGYSTSTNSTVRFGAYADGGLFYGISGSLGAIFPTINNNGVLSVPGFSNLFYNCSNLTGEIPENLFAGVTGNNTRMFESAFANTNITSIPENLFGRVVDGTYYGVSGAAQGMFASTFAHTNITSIPENLFGRVVNGTYYGVSGAAAIMFASTFAHTNITSIPENLFGRVVNGTYYGVSGAAQGMFASTFLSCTGLTSLPNGLFRGGAGTARNLFGNTFYNCSQLSGYIPKDLFNFGTGGLTYNASNGMMTGIFSGTNLATSCEPYDLPQYVTDFDSYFGGKVVCGDPDVTVNFSCQMPTNVPDYPIGYGTNPSPIVAPITSGNVTFTFPSGANCDGYDYGTKLNAWTCDSPVCNNRTWSSNGTAVFNEPWDGSTELNFHMVYEPAVFTVPLDEDRYYYDENTDSRQVDTSPTPGNVTTLYEKYGFGWSTNPNGPFTTTLTLSAGDLPTANGFEFVGWDTIEQPDENDPVEIYLGNQVVDASGRVTMSPFVVIDSFSPRLVAEWAEINTDAQNYVSLDCDNGAFAQDFNGTSTFNENNGYSAEVQYGDNIVVPSKNACERQGYYYNQWNLAPVGVITAGNNNTNYTWNHSFSGSLRPYWQQIQTTITLNPQNGNAGGGTTALYTIAQNQDYDSKSGVYLDSARTQLMTTTSNSTVTAPTAPTATLTFNLNDSVAAPATISYTPKSYYYGNGGNTVSQTCGQRYGITISNDGKTFTTPYQFNGYYSAASGGTQYVGKREALGTNFYFITQAGIDAGLAYSTDTTWYGQWDTLDPITACADNGLSVSRPGYTFDGWYTAASGGTQVTNFAVSQNTTVYAHWTAVTYTITLNKNNVDAVDGSVTAVYEQYSVGWATTNRADTTFGALTLSGNQLPTRTGYTFAGFYDAASGGNPVGTFSNGAWTPPSSTTYTAAATLYAYWTPATYNITYNYQGGSNTSALPSGYTQVKYIISSQKIPLGFYTNQDSEIEARWTRVATASQYIYQANSGSSLTNNTTAYVSSSGGNWRFGNKAFSLTPAVGSEIVSVQNKNGVKFNGETVGTYTGVNNFAGNVEFGALGGSSIQLSYIKHRQNGVLLGNYVACQRNSDSAVGLCDLVSGVFYTNADATITAGSAVTTPYPATYTYGVGATVYGLPSRANSVFESWCRGYDSTNNTYSDCAFPHEINITDLGNKNMYAKWVCKPNYHLNGTGANETCEPDVYAITLDKNANDAVDGVTTVYEQYGIGWATTNTAQTAFGNITLTGNLLPTRTGYALIGFYDAAENGNAVGTFNNGVWTPPAANTYTAGATLYAQWLLQTYNATFTCKPIDSVYDALKYIMGANTNDSDIYQQQAPVATMQLSNGDQFTVPSRENCELQAGATANGWFANGGQRWSRGGIDSYTPGQDYIYQSIWGDATFNPVYSVRNVTTRYYCSENGSVVVRDLVSPLLGGANNTPGYERVVLRGIGNGDDQVNCAQPANSVGFVGWFADAASTTLHEKTFTPGALIGQYNDVTAFPARTVKFTAVWDCNEGYVYDRGTGQCVLGVHAISLDKNADDAVNGTVTTVYEQYSVGWATTNTDQTTFGALALSGNQLPTRPGYVFAGYADAATNGNAVGTFGNGTWTAPVATTYNAAATLYAQWTVATYNITYNYNGGTVGSSALPAGYTQLEYIESDGAQIIDTGVAGIYTRAAIDAQYTGTDNALDMLAGYDIGTYVGAYVGVYNKKWTLTESATGLTSVSALNRSNVSVVFDRDTNNNYYNRSTITVDGETVTATRSNFRDGNTLKLFNGRSSGASNGFVGRIYRAMIYKNDSDVVIFDGVPARRNSDDALGIYDTVSGTFLENVGTGTFTAGADITTPYPATYTYGVGTTVYGMPVRANSVFVGWCRDSALTTGCGMPHEIAGTTVGDVALYAKYDCVYGYSANAQTGQCELSTPMFTITTTQIEPGTVFKFNLGARGTFVVDWGDGTQPQIINSNTVADTQYTHTYAANAFGGMATKSFTIGFSGRGVGYSSTNTVPTIKFFNATVDGNMDIVSDDQGNPMDGTEVYIASISGSLGAMFPVIGNGGTKATTPSFYQTFRNAKNMSQTMASLADLFDGINGAPVVYMFSRTFQDCSGLTGNIPENLFGRVVNGTYYGINGAPASYMFFYTFRNCSGLTGSIPENLFGRVVNGTYYGINGAPAANMFFGTFRGCSGLTGTIPGNLFVGINGAPASHMFRETFYGCSGLTGTIPENLFVGINGAPAANMFHETFRGCLGLTGSIPENLFGRVVNGTYYGINGAPASYMFLGTFRSCSGLTGSIPGNLFERVVNGTYYGINGTPASYMFYETFRGCSGLTGSIPENLFAGISGTPAARMFYATFHGCSGLTGSIPGNLFGRVVNNEFVGISGAPKTYMFASTFLNCTGLTGSIPATLFGRAVNGTYYGISGTPASYMFYGTFEGDRYLTGEIPSYLFGHLSGDAKEGMFSRTFYNCRGLTGTIPGNLFGGQNLTGPASTYAFYYTFNGCSNLSGYVPEQLFGQMTLPATPPTGMMTSIFGGTGLETSCPCGTTQVTSSPFRTYWSGKVSCAPGLDVGQHWYNGQCTTMCSNSSIDELHVGALPAFPILADKITTPSINVKYGDTICYVPLVAGNGGTNSLNMSYGGNVYHADRPDDVQPVGFAQRD